jgi:hypothetical protein
MRVVKNRQWVGSDRHIIYFSFNYFIQNSYKYKIRRWNDDYFLKDFLKTLNIKDGN